MLTIKIFFPALRILLSAFIFCWAIVAVADVADVKSAARAVPDFTSRVIDQTATLTALEQAALAQRLQLFEEAKGSQVAVLIIATSNPETIEQYALRVAELWQLGRKKIDDGVIKTAFSTCNDDAMETSSAFLTQNIK